MRFIQQETERLDEMEGCIRADAQPPDSSRVLRYFRSDEHDVIARLFVCVHRRSDAVGFTEVLVVEQLKEDAADDGAGLETNLSRIGCLVPVCQRDAAIYGTMALFSLCFFLSRNRIRRVDWKLWLIAGVLPMGIDGIWQMVSQLIPGLPFRESTPFLRTLTGALFGFFTCWYLLPTLERSLREGEM